MQLNSRSTFFEKKIYCVPSGGSGMHVERQPQFFAQLHKTAEYLELYLLVRFVLDHPVIKTYFTDRRELIFMHADKIAHLRRKVQIQNCRIKAGCSTNRWIPGGQREVFHSVIRVFTDRNNRSDSCGFGSLQNLREIVIKDRITKMGVRIHDRSHALQHIKIGDAPLFLQYTRSAKMDTSYCWILDSGGAGRGAWQGGVIYEFMRWCRENGAFPSITMGASAGGYAAADVATGTERTVMKGWTYWGTKEARALQPQTRSRFRAHLRSSIHYVMDESEMAGVFSGAPGKRLLIFTTRARRRDCKSFGTLDSLRFFLKSATRKLPKPLKYLPDYFVEDPVVFALNLPEELQSDYVRPLTRENYHGVIEASCLIPMAMGAPLAPNDINRTPSPGDFSSVFLDGGYALKMPMRVFEQDARFKALGHWARADKTVIFCCDPQGYLWETSARLQQLNTIPSIAKAVEENRLLVIHPDHKVEAGFLCMDNDTTMRTFHRGQEQAHRLLGSEDVCRFFGA